MASVPIIPNLAHCYWALFHKTGIFKSFDFKRQVYSKTSGNSAPDCHFLRPGCAANLAPAVPRAANVRNVVLRMPPVFRLKAAQEQLTFVPAGSAAAFRQCWLP
jgi:hypothetical protein